VNLTARDRKIVFALVPIIVLAGFWFLVLAPKRDQAASAEQSAAKQQQRAETARTQLAQAKSAETDFASDYGEIVRLGKAVPASVDMPSLIVQLDEAAEGTGIRFTKIATGDRTTTGATSPTTPPAAPPSGDAGTQSGQGTTPAAAGGAPAQSAPGSAAESANNAAATSDQRNAAAEQSGVSPSDTQTSSSSGQGLPVGGGTAAPGAPAAAGTSSVAGLETVPLELEFTGDFFNLADFFHDVKRFVNVAGTSVVVGGRLITIEGVKYASDPELFPKIKAELTATVYLSPKAEGTSAGATPAGPSGTTPASTPAAVEDSAPVTPAPTAAATP
jgi:Tfp pilus assembly protein PilO